MIPRKSIGQIINMNFGFFGIQFSFGLQQSNMSPIYQYLGADEGSLPMLWLAGPVTGLLVQPLVGAVSDETWTSRLGRRKPFILLGALIASIGLLFMPFSQSLWMAAGLLWILDAANNMAMEPYRAYVSDELPHSQQPVGFLMQSFFTGLGITLANFTPAILISLGLLGLNDQLENGIPTSTYWAFGIGAAASIGSVVYSMITTREQPATPEQLHAISQRKATGSIWSRTFVEVTHALNNMPTGMKLLVPVKFFTWYAMFCYWQYLTSAIAKTQFGTSDVQSEGFRAAQVLSGQLNGTYNVVTFALAFALVPLARKWGAARVHTGALLLGGIGVLSIPHLSVDETILGGIPTIYLFTLGLGVAWASIMAMPYQMLAASVPTERTGVYMGIFNMFIVIPMMIQIGTMQWFVFDWLGRDSVRVLQLAGSFLILGGLFSLLLSKRITPAS
jgi:maltose/moltooligosaccharide transporter